MPGQRTRPVSFPLSLLSVCVGKGHVLSTSHCPCSLCAWAKDTSSQLPTVLALCVRGQRTRPVSFPLSLPSVCVDKGHVLSASRCPCSLCAWAKDTSCQLPTVLALCVRGQRTRPLSFPLSLLSVCVGKGHVLSASHCPCSLCAWAKDTSCQLPAVLALCVRGQRTRPLSFPLSLLSVCVGKGHVLSASRCLCPCVCGQRTRPVSFPLSLPLCAWTKDTSCQLPAVSALVCVDKGHVLSASRCPCPLCAWTKDTSSQLPAVLALCVRGQRTRSVSFPLSLLSVCVDKGHVLSASRCPCSLCAWAKDTSCQLPAVSALVCVGKGHVLSASRCLCPCVCGQRTRPVSFPLSLPLCAWTKDTSCQLPAVSALVCVVKHTQRRRVLATTNKRNVERQPSLLIDNTH